MRTQKHPTPGGRRLRVGAAGADVSLPSVLKTVAPSAGAHPIAVLSAIRARADYEIGLRSKELEKEQGARTDKTSGGDRRSLGKETAQAGIPFQRAMAVAMMYPDGGVGGRGKAAAQPRFPWSLIGPSEPPA